MDQQINKSKAEHKAMVDKYMNEHPYLESLPSFIIKKCGNKEYFYKMKDNSRESIYKFLISLTPSDLEYAGW
jgi:hypothetical protein